MSWAWEQEGISAPAKLVLLALADHADDSGKCWPGTRLVAEKCGISRSTLGRHLVTLKERGLVEVRPRWRDDKGQTTNIYLLAVPTLSTDETVGADRRDGRVTKAATRFLTRQREPSNNHSRAGAGENGRLSRRDLVKLDAERHRGN